MESLILNLFELILKLDCWSRLFLRDSALVAAFTKNWKAQLRKALLVFSLKIFTPWSLA